MNKWGDSNDEPMSERTASAWIQERYMIRLKAPGFDPEDETLVPKAGKCSACPFRTGNMKKDYPDLKAPDVCTNPSCFQAKRLATIERKEEKALEKGTKVLTQKQYQDQQDKYVRLDHQEYIGGNYQSYRKLLGKHCPPVTLVREEDRDGEMKLVEIVERAAVKTAIKEHKLAPIRSQSQSPAERKRQQTLKAHEQTALETRPKIIDGLVHAPTDIHLWRLLAQTAAAGSSYHFQKRLEDHGITLTGDAWNWRSNLAKALEAITDEEKIKRLTWDLLLGEGSDYEGFQASFERAAALVKVDLDKLLEQQLEAMQSKEKEKAAKATAKAAAEEAKAKLQTPAHCKKLPPSGGVPGYEVDQAFLDYAYQSDSIEKIDRGKIAKPFSLDGKQYVCLGSTLIGPRATKIVAYQVIPKAEHKGETHQPNRTKGYDIPGTLVSHGGKEFVIGERIAITPKPETFKPGELVYYNNPQMYKCGVRVEVVDPKNERHVKRWGKDVIEKHIKDTGKDFIPVWMLGIDVSERRSGMTDSGDRLNGILPSGLSHDKLTFT